IPQPEDAARPQDWTEDALFRLESRDAYRRIVNLGLTDALRARIPADGQYTFWDYQRGSWQRNDGIRIDHFLLSPGCADLLRDVGIDKEVRGREKPSDHVPIWIEIDL
ncbi:MAG: exodeoxyribonuclease III, partial [Rhodobacterales bacterium]